MEAMCGEALCVDGIPTSREQEYLTKCVEQCLKATMKLENKQER